MSEKEARRSSEEIAGPTCPKCQAPMDPASYVPGLGHLAGRIFECGKCGYIHVIPDA
jgi:hypothetical protein